MAYCTLGGISVVEARLALVRVGVWSASIILDSEIAPNGQVDLEMGGARFSGTVLRSGADGGFASALIVGGAAGMSQLVRAQGYHDTTVRTPLAHILDAAGETLSANSDRDLLDQQLVHWATREGAAGAALSALIDGAGATWRMLPSGEVWVGVESWPAASVDAELLGYDGAADRIRFYAPTPSILPGTTLAGRRISRVEHSVSAEMIRTLAWCEP